MGQEIDVAIRLNAKVAPVSVGERVPRGLTGFVLRDGRGHEHHFGSPEPYSPTAEVYEYVGTYAPGSGYAFERGLRDELRAGFEVVEPVNGPSLAPYAVAAIQDVVDHWSNNGFTVDEEKHAAVETLLFLASVDELQNPDDLYVVAATAGLDVEAADRFRRFAEQVRDGGSFRPEIKLRRDVAERHQAARGRMRLRDVPDPATDPADGVRAGF